MLGALTWRLSCDHQVATERHRNRVFPAFRLAPRRAPPRPLSQLRPLCPSAWESGFWGGPDLRVERSSMLGPPAVRLRAEDFT